ncbi:MAG TPA: Crp/Fnr family transcriptional regulator [Terriglobales bacterium]|nr:Crp/Fnr family transcriptional regulator [Terriglobales bacterium]
MASTAAALTRKRRLAKPKATPAGDIRPWPEALLAAIVEGKRRISLRKGELLYSQGQLADAVYFVEHGKVRLSVLSKAGREAILGTMTAGEFCGEGCLTGQALRVGSATALTATTVFKVQKPAMVRALHEQHPLSEEFLATLLARNIAFEEDICDQLFNHSEKRLARALLKLARFGQEPAHPDGQPVTPKISQQALADMIGTTRSRVNFFMNKFRRLGLIEYNGEVRVHPELLTDVVLSD